MLGSHRFSPVILTTVLQGLCSTHFTGKKSKVQGDYVTDRWGSFQVTQLWFESKVLLHHVGFHSIPHRNANHLLILWEAAVTMGIISLAVTHATSWSLRCCEQS